MKAAFLTGRERIEVRDIPAPALQEPDHVLLRIKAVGICGSDIHYYSGGGIGDQRVVYPFCLGHECAGEIVEVGAAVRRFKPGELVTVDPAQPCGTCSQCRKGRFNTCENLLFLGSPGQLPGVLCEYLTLPQSCCYRAPSHLSAAQAALAEPLSIALHALSFLHDPGSADIVVFGCGPIGLSVILAAGYTGVRSIFAAEKIDYRLRAASLLDIAGSGNPGQEDIAAKFCAVKPAGFAAAIECCGQQEAIEQGIRMLTPGGRLIIVGIPETERITLDPHILRRKEISIHNVRRQNKCMAKAVELLAHHISDFDFMITHRFALEEIGAAFRLLKNYDDGIIKGVCEDAAPPA